MSNKSVNFLGYSMLFMSSLIVLTTGHITSNFILVTGGSFGSTIFFSIIMVYIFREIERKEYQDGLLDVTDKFEMYYSLKDIIIEDFARLDEESNEVGKRVYEIDTQSLKLYTIDNKTYLHFRYIETKK